MLRHICHLKKINPTTLHVLKFSGIEAINVVNSKTTLVPNVHVA